VNSPKRILLLEIDAGDRKLMLDWAAAGISSFPPPQEKLALTPRPGTPRLAVSRHKSPVL